MIRDEHRAAALAILAEWYKDLAVLDAIKKELTTTPLERRTIEFSKGLLSQAAAQLDTALRVGDAR